MKAGKNWLLRAQIRARNNHRAEKRTALLSTVLSVWLSKLGLGLRSHVLLGRSCRQPFCNPPVSSPPNLEISVLPLASKSLVLWSPLYFLSQSLHLSLPRTFIKSQPLEPFFFSPVTRTSLAVSCPGAFDFVFPSPGLILPHSGQKAALKVSSHDPVLPHTLSYFIKQNLITS